MPSGDLMEWWSNKIPMGAIILETLVASILVFLTLFVFKKYFERKKKPGLYLGLTFLSFTLASMTTAIGRWVGYFSPIDYLDLSITDLTTLLSYIFIAISNCFAVIFVDSIYFNKGIDFTFSFVLVNGTIIGLLLPQIYTWIYIDQSFGLIRQKSVQLIVISLSLLSLISYGLISVFSFRESRLSTEHFHKVGFILIGLYGIFIPLLFLSFAGDTVLISNVSAFSKGYTPFYYLGWVFALIGIILGYLGYIMPKWFKLLINKVGES